MAPEFRSSTVDTNGCQITDGVCVGVDLHISTFSLQTSTHTRFHTRFALLFIMYSFFVLAALGAFAVANPVPQEIDLEMVAAAPDPTFSQAVGITAQVVTFNSATIVAQATSVTEVTVDATDAASPTDTPAARLARRGNCATQPAGATGAPSVTTDTPSAFVSNSAFASVASAAATPSGYDRTFVNLAGSNNAYGYMVRLVIPDSCDDCETY